jgi:hypothetical protein
MQKLKFLDDRVHGILDYGVVLILALAPVGLGITGASAILCYALAVIHLVMTVLTDMPLGVVKVIPLKVHAAIELVVGLALIFVGWIFGDLLLSGQLFFTVMGALIFFVWVASNYGDRTRVP